MQKRYVLIVTFVIVFLFFSGCLDFNQTSNDDDNDNGLIINQIMDLESVIQITDFTNDVDHHYSSISGNGEKIIYNQYNTETYPLADTDFTVSPQTIWVTDTAGSMVQTQIFDGWDENGLYAFYGDNGGTPVLNYDASYAYFGVEKYINYIGYYWLPAHNPDYLARVKISDKSFHPIDLIEFPGYDFVWLQCFRLTSNSIYCLVTFNNKDGMGTNVEGVGFLKMNLDGSGQEFIYTETDLTTDSCPRTGYIFFVEETSNRLYYESRDNGYYYLDFNTYTPVRINNEEIVGYWLRGVSGRNLIFSENQEFYIYDTNSEVLNKVENDEDGSDLYSITSDKIFYNRGSGLFSYTDFEGNRVKLIGEEEENFSIYKNRFTWDSQFTPTNGKPISEDGTKLLVKEPYYDSDNPNYYILKLSKSTSSNNKPKKVEEDDVNPPQNPATIIHSIQMFDFSTGQYVSEDMSTEDLDVITITDENKVRLYAHNTAVIREIGVTGFLYYIDVSTGSTCELVDDEGGIATFTVDSFGTTTEGYPKATITWSYTK